MSSRRIYEDLDRQLMASGRHNMSPRGHDRRSRSRSPPRKKYESRNESRNEGSRSRRSYRSRSHEGGGRRDYGGRGGSPGQRRRYTGSGRPIPENIEASKCLGVFGLSLRTTERDLRDVFSRYGPIEECTVVIDAQTGRSRGFAFIYFEAIADAQAAKESCNNIEIDERRIRVDFSITQRAHTPTPGVYMGKVDRKGDGRRGGGGGGYRRDGRGRDDRGGRDYGRREYQPRRSPPRRRDSRSRSPHDLKIK